MLFTYFLSVLVIKKKPLIFLCFHIDDTFRTKMFVLDLLLYYITNKFNAAMSHLYELIFLLKNILLIIINSLIILCIYIILLHQQTINSIVLIFQIFTVYTPLHYQSEKIIFKKERDNDDMNITQWTALWTCILFLRSK